MVNIYSWSRKIVKQIFSNFFVVAFVKVMRTILGFNIHFETKDILVLKFLGLYKFFYQKKLGYKMIFAFGWFYSKKNLGCFFAKSVGL